MKDLLFSSLDMDAGKVDQAIQWRRDLHKIPELQYDLPQTTAFVARLLTEMGVDALYRDFAPHSLVAVIKGRKGSGKTVALRADMDALPIQEVAELPYRSLLAQQMHACGHDGHMATLLLAASVLSETRDFAGTCVLVFQPAEEGGGGARRMIEGGLFATERFSIDEIYGLHNLPGLEVGKVQVRQGPLMAASDRFDLTINGRGSHAAQPHHGRDPIVIGSAIVQHIQSITSRMTDPLKPAVVSVTTFDARSAYNVIPSTVTLRGSVRTLEEKQRSQIEAELTDLAKGFAALHQIDITLDYRRGYDPLINDDHGYKRICRLFETSLPQGAYQTDAPPIMAAEDFSYYLKHKPGCFFFTGNGDSAQLHNDRYDFNDAALAHGAALWINLIRMTEHA